MDNQLYRTSKLEAAEAMAAIATARRALGHEEPPPVELLVRVTRVLGDMAQMVRPEDDFLLALTSELELLRERLQTAIARTGRKIAKTAEMGTAINAYAARGRH